MNHVSKIIIIIIIKRYKSQMGMRRREKVCEVREFLFLLFLLFVSFSYLRKSDRRFLSRLKAKLIHAARATRGYQSLGVSSNSTR